MQNVSETFSLVRNRKFSRIMKQQTIISAERLMFLVAVVRLYGRS